MRGGPALSLLCLGLLVFSGALFAQTQVSRSESSAPGFVSYPSQTKSAEPAAEENEGGEENVTLVAADRVLVRFRPEANNTRRAEVLTRVRGEAKFFSAPNRQMVRAQAAPQRNSVFEQLAVVDLPDGSDLEAVVRQLNRHPDVLYAEPDYRIQITQLDGPEVVPDDFNFEDMWHLRNTGQSDGLAGFDIRAAGAWAYSTGSRDIVLAVIDTGIDYYHPDLVSNIWNNPGEVPGDGIDNDANGFIDDVHGYDFVSDDSDPMDDQNHGTHVAGIAGASGNNQTGVVGVNWEVGLMALKSFDDTGSGRVSDMIRAIHYAIENGARIINASWGDEEPSESMHDAVREATEAGLVFVAAAGNNGNANGFYPASFEETIAVGAVNRKGEASRFTNYGDFVDVAAPGEQIYSAFPNNRYITLNGTSMAAPQVAGLAALILSVHPDFTNNEIRNIIVNAVEPLNTTKALGSGLINVAKAVRIDTPLATTRLDLPDKIYGEIQIDGSAFGDNFFEYTLWYGEGSFPESWTPFFTATVPVENGTLVEIFDTSILPDGTHSIRLTAENGSGYLSESRKIVEVSNVHISGPLHNDIYRLGDRIEIHGTVFGLDRSYTIEVARGESPASWNVSGITLSGNGDGEKVDALLGVWDTSGLQSNEFYSLRLTGTDPAGQTTEFVTRVIYLDQLIKEGWPRRLPRTTDFPKDYWRAINVADLDGDGFKEILTVNPEDGDVAPATLQIFHHDGSEMLTIDLGFDGPVSEIPVIGDLDGNGADDVVVFGGSPTRLRAFEWNADQFEEKWSFPVSTQIGPKLIADLDGDGLSEVVLKTAAASASTGTLFGELIVLDFQGSPVRRWSIGACDSDADVLPSQPAVGDLDGDGDLEIIAVTSCDLISAFDLDVEGSPLWQYSVAGEFVASPVVGDLDANGENEIIIGANDPEKKGRGGLYVFDGYGFPREGWPIYSDQSFVSTAALGDLNGNGDLEIIVQSRLPRGIHVLDNQGFELDGWPVTRTPTSSLNSQVLLGDINGDGEADLVLATPGIFSVNIVLNPLRPYFGGILGWTSDGNLFDFNPISDYEFIALEGSKGYAKYRQSPPLLDDLNKDGQLEMVSVTLEDLAFSSGSTTGAFPKRRGSLFVHQLDVPFKRENYPWPQFQGNPSQTGYVPPAPRANHPPVGFEIPDQVIPLGGSFLPVALDRHVGDPDNFPAEITWTAEAGGNLGVTIDENRVATVAVIDPAWSGSETVRFTAADPSGASVVLEATYSVRLDYRPPVLLPDFATTDEDTAVIIDVLANDFDPSDLALTLRQISRPLHGTVTDLRNGTIRYQPDSNFSGDDSFIYIADNGDGGISSETVTVRVLPVNDPPTPVPDRLIVLEDEEATINVLENDFDPEGGPFALISFTNPENGVLTDFGSGVFSYRPDLDFSGTDGFEYVVEDELGAQSAGLVSIRTQPVNDAPVVWDQTYTLNRNTSKTISFLAQDAEKDDLKFTITNTTRHGTIFQFPDVAEYRPEKGFSGQDSFTYRATDGRLFSQTATVTYTVTDRNNPPVATKKDFRTLVNQTISITLAAKDADEDPLRFSLTRAPEHGTLLGSNQEYTYTPDLDYLGDDSLEFKVTDGLDFTTMRVTITVTDINTTPTTESQRFTTRINTPVELELKAEDFEGTVPQFLIISGPANGTLQQTERSFTYTPRENYVGSDRFDFKAFDGEFESKLATAFIDVRFPNDPPVAEDILLKLVGIDLLQFDLPATDVDDDLLLGAILEGPKRGLVAGGGTSYTYYREGNFLGRDSFTYKVWDGYAYSNVGTVTIQVEPAPVGGPLTIDIVGFLSSARVVLGLQTPGTGTVLIEGSNNLKDWEPLRTVVADVELFELEFPVGSESPDYFYRAIWSDD